jgi:hypothetical protein
MDRLESLLSYMTKHMRAGIKTTEEEMRATTSAGQEKMEATISARPPSRRHELGA